MPIGTTITEYIIEEQRRIKGVSGDFTALINDIVIACKAIASAPRFSADSATALMSFALAGCGIALLPAWLVAEKVAQRELVPLLSEYHFPQQGVYALYPDAQHMPTRVRAFIDFLREKVG